MIQLYI